MDVDITGEGIAGEDITRGAMDTPIDLIEIMHLAILIRTTIIVPTIIGDCDIERFPIQLDRKALYTFALSHFRIDVAVAKHRQRNANQRPVRWKMLYQSIEASPRWIASASRVNPGPS